MPYPADPHQFSFVKDSGEADVCHYMARGQISTSQAYKMQKELEACLEPGRANIIINMFFVTFFSSAGVRVILNISKRARLLGGKLLIEDPSDNVKNILGMIALNDMLLK